MWNYYGSTTGTLPPKRKEDKRKEVKGKEEEKKFNPPSLDDVKKYVSEKKLSVDAKQFYDYFTEGNWVDSKGNPVKSWKQKVLTWNGYANKGNPTKKTSNHEQREYDNLDFLYANVEGANQ